MIARVARVALLTTLVTTSAFGQAVRGRVVLPDSVTPAAGVRVEVRDSARGVVGWTVTGQSGRFSLQLPGPGDYLMQVARIGYRPSMIPLPGVLANEGRTLDVYIAEQPLQLDELEVTGTDQCRMSRTERARFIEAWVRAREALGPHVSEGRNEVVVEVLEVAGTEDGPARNYGNERVWNAVPSYPEADSTSARHRYSSDFLATTPIDTLALVGHVRGRIDEGLEFDVPNPEFVLSDRFLASHCFGLEGGPRGHPDWIGLRFRPAGAPDTLTDIRGTLWVDQTTAVLRRLDFEYQNLPRIPFQTCRVTNRPPRIPFGQARYGPNCSWEGFRGRLLQREGIGGSVHFTMLADGRWFAHQWTIRTPGEEFVDRYLGFTGRPEDGRLVRCSDRPPRCNRIYWAVPRLVVSNGAVAVLLDAGVHIYRDESTLAAISRVASLQAGRSPAHLTGAVLNAEGRPVPGAVVGTERPVRAAMTDHAGRFEIASLPAGTLTIYVRRRGYRDLERTVVLTAHATLDLPLTLIAAPPEH